jgi:phosphoribosylformylglycinamidine synthase
VNIAVLQFPGANGDQDSFHLFASGLGLPTRYVWHKETSLGEADLVVLPGGFAYGDYLRCGAIARFSPIMQAVQAFAAQGGLVYGICNGFQILCEAGLLPGALIRNSSLEYRCIMCRLEVEASTPGRRPASQRIWKPLQMPSTVLPCTAASFTAGMMGEKRAMAPQRR